MSSGAEDIAIERARQIVDLGRDTAHDQQWTEGQLVEAAMAYAASTIELNGQYVPNSVPFWWPWDRSWWHPEPDRIANLVKAGALIAAEIDRLRSLEQVNEHR